MHAFHENSPGSITENGIIKGADNILVIITVTKERQNYNLLGQSSKGLKSSFGCN